MPTSRLIDINTAAITYRRECLVALEKKRYNTCIGCINTMNSLLPEDEGDLQYRIIFDDDEYDKVVNSNDHIICNNCSKEHDYNMMEFQELYLPSNEQMVTLLKTNTVWVCPNCNEFNELENSRIIENVIQSPFYYRYIPNPPRFTGGLESQLTFHTKMVQWVWMCLKNLEDGFTRFRDDNWNKDKNMIEQSTIDTTLDEMNKLD